MANEARQIDPERLSRFESAKLLHGSHGNIDQGGCLLEWAAFLAGRSHSDRPPCVSPSIAAFGRSWNDALSEDRRQMLKPYAKGLRAERAMRKRGAIGILRELHRYFDFDQPFDPCPHGGGAKPCCCGFHDPTGINKVFAEAYAFLSQPRKTRSARRLP